MKVHLLLFRKILSFLLTLYYINKVNNFLFMPNLIGGYHFVLSLTLPRTQSLKSYSIHGSYLNSIIDSYVNVFPINERYGRFFKLLSMNLSLNDIVSTNRPIGQNTMRQYGHTVASDLGLDNPQSYGCHCWRTGYICRNLSLNINSPPIVTRFINIID
jgi:hypothetical protein